MNIFTSRFGRLAPVSELDVLQLYPTAWATHAAVELHRHLRRRRPTYVIVCHSTYLHTRRLYKIPINKLRQHELEIIKCIVSVRVLVLNTL